MKQKEKTILVTGASRGIGKEIAIAFARIGFKVYVNVRVSLQEAKGVVKTIESIGGKAVLVQADVSNEAHVKRMFKTIEKNIDGLDVLVNNAGWSTRVEFKDLDRISGTMFSRIIDANLKSVFLCSRIAASKIRKKGLILNIASTSGVSGEGSNIVYCAAKAGVISLTKSFARQCAPHIRVNAIAPGYTDTDFIKTTPRSLINQEIKATPLKRITKPEDIAQVAVALYRDMTFLTGETICVDGGRSLK